jgi:regulator of sigma E protease
LDNLNTPQLPPANAADDKDNPSAGAWLWRNGLTISLALVVFVWLYRTFGIEGMTSIGLAGLGLGFLIFVHELGHFLVAKWCDVHIETFSVGFGPAIPGCSFQRGETFYKLAWFPLGGYLKMVGEGPEEDEHENDPRSFKNKPVWQRMAIISAGVVMNTVAAFLLFIIVFMTRGAEMRAGYIGAIDCGSPAWQQGVRSGARIVQINDISDPYFNDVMQEIMTTRASQSLSFVYEMPDGSGRDVAVRIEPRREEDDIKPMVGIMEPVDLLLVDKPEPGRYEPAPVLQESAAARAVPPFAFGDRIVGTSDPEHPDKIKPIANDYAEFYRRLCLLKAEPMVMQVARTSREGQDETVDIKVPVQGTWRLGLRMRMGHVTAIRENSPALKAGVQPRNLPAGSEGDIIKEIELPEPDGTRTRYVTSRDNVAPAPGVTIQDLDPERLPFDLDQWATRRQAGAQITLVVLRPVVHAARGTVTLKADWDDSFRFNREVPFGANSPLSIPGLGLAYRVDTYVEAVDSSSPAQLAGIRQGDVVKAVRFRQPGKTREEEKTPSKWVDLHDEQWASLFWSMQHAEFKEFDLRIEREKRTEEVTLRALADLTWPQAERGLHLMPSIRYQKADSPAQAVALGLHITADTIRRIYQTLVALVTSRVSSKSMGGPIAIGYATYRTAQESIFSFLQLLAVISINLAVINFLPIPVLDGGHMVFLGYELVRGRPASEQVRIFATYAGLILILSLMLFVIFRDVSRLL